MIILEDFNYCEHCGQILNDKTDTIYIREGKLFHEECLPENLKEENDNG